ncbi:MAG: hypothetical protein K2H87_01910 [Duncaniella sp.]|nr:hypothetical protein [Duncaniella sp.]
MVNFKDWRITIGGAEAIVTVKKGSTVVWQLARACFSGPLWRDDRPWLYNEKWSYGKDKR